MSRTQKAAIRAACPLYNKQHNVQRFRLVGHEYVAVVPAALDELGPVLRTPARAGTHKQNCTKPPIGSASMTLTDLAGRTDREHQQYAADHGRTAALALGFLLLAAHVREHGAEDMEILGRTQMPEPPAYKVAVFDGTDDEQRSRVDAWARRHSVTAATDEASGHYEAAVPYGPVRLVVYMVPEKVMAGRLAEAKARREDIAREVAGQHDAITAGRSAA